MASAKTSTTGPKSKRSSALGPGLHVAKIELRSGRSFRIRTLTGVRTKAVVGDEVDEALVEECLRGSRSVIVADTSRGPTILGALQTTRSMVHEPDGGLRIEGKEIRLRAGTRIVLEAGNCALRVENGGVMRAEGDRMVIDMGSNVKVLSALVELP